MTNAPHPWLSSCLPLYQQVSVQEPLGTLRPKAWEALAKLGLPTRKNPKFENIRLHELFTIDCRRPAQPDQDGLATIDQTKMVWLQPECQGNCLVFMNGAYRPELSSLQSLVDKERLVILPLKEALRTYGALLNNRWQQLVKEEQDPFSLLNLSLHEQGLFLYIPPKKQLKTPIQILHLIDSPNAKAVTFPRAQIVLGQEASASFVATTVLLSGEPVFSAGALDFMLGERASVHLLQLQTEKKEALWQFDSIHAELKKESRFEAVSLANGGNCKRTHSQLTLAGEESYGSLNGLSLLDSTAEAHVSILMHHKAPNCQSRQLFKNLLQDKSRASFDATIAVDPEAQKTDAFQLNNTLLLSDHAKGYSRPNLRIFADDVKASHGATVGQLDEEELFYLRSRGLGRQEASKLLIEAFSEEVCAHIQQPSARKLAKELVYSL